MKGSIHLVVKYFDKSHKVTYKNKGYTNSIIRRLEKNILAKNEGKWEWAILYVNGDLQQYYHHLEGVNKLDKNNYTVCINRSITNLYIIEKCGNVRTLRNKKIQDMATHFNSSVREVRAYRNNKIIAYYNENGFQMEH